MNTLDDASNPAIRSGRLALYLYVAEQARGGRITSHEIGEALGINSTQVRRDLLSVPVAGRRGVGFTPSELAEALRRELTPHRDAIADLAEQYRARHEQLARVADRLR